MDIFYSIISLLVFGYAVYWVIQRFKNKNKNEATGGGKPGEDQERK